jgi:hypothetical protein
LVKPEETEASVADTEIMLVGRARLSVLARGTDQDVKWGN